MAFAARRHNSYFAKPSQFTPAADNLITSKPGS